MQICLAILFLLMNYPPIKSKTRLTFLNTFLDHTQILLRYFRARSEWIKTGKFLLLQKDANNGLTCVYTNAAILVVCNAPNNALSR